MSKRSWIVLSIIAAPAAALAGAVAGIAAYVHRARKAATVTARETFDPYYAMVEYLQSTDGKDPELDGV